MYDLIGDIHGYAQPLRKLLIKLGYTENGDDFSHPERKVIFLGDFIDRGPNQVEVCNIARTMIERGNAYSIMGNHEFNAVAYTTKDPSNNDTYLRPHNDKNYQQHKAFLDEVLEDSTLHNELVNWFKTLPLYLDLPEFRVVHACWHPSALDILDPHLDSEYVLLESVWPVVCQKGRSEFEALEILLKGLEIRLPDGKQFTDEDNHPRTNIRTKWWKQTALTYQELAMVSSRVIHQIPHEPVETNILPGYDGVKPVFIGHYWLNGMPKPLTEHVVCLDYGIAAAKSQDRKLVAYRWQEDKVLSEDNFVWVGL